MGKCTEKWIPIPLRGKKGFFRPKIGVIFREITIPMRKSLLIIIGLLPALTFAQNDTLVKLFRKVQFHKKDIVLADNIQKFKDIVVKDNSSNYHLKKGSFGVADSISLEVNSADQIVAFRFFYNYEPEFSNDTAYIHELRKYQKIINAKGREYTYSSAQIAYKVTKWEEKQTAFELIEVTSNGKKKTYSVIFDKAPYNKRLNCSDAKGSETSLEILAILK